MEGHVRDARISSTSKNRASHDTTDKQDHHIDLDDAERIEPSAETYAAIMATNKPNPRGPGYIKLYLLAGMIFLCSTMNGFDSSLMGSINALPNYTEYFGLPSNGNASTGIVFAIFQISPAAYRGTIAGAYNTFYNVGSILATSAVYACHLHLADQGDLDWRIPLWLQMVCPGMVCFFIKFFPESPRYLVANDQHEKAREIITNYHTNGDPNHPLVTLQMKEMLGTLQGAPDASWKDLLDLRILNIVYSVIGWAFSVVGARLHDVVGRRKMLMGSTLGMTISLALVAAGAAGKVEYGNDAAATMSIVFIFLFGAIFSTGYTPMQPIYPAEVVSNKMRAKAMGTFKLTAGAAGFLNTFVGPIALNSIGYWFYVFFVFWDAFEITFMYFFFVETKGMTLEELDAIFEAKNPRKASIEVKNMQSRIMKEERANEQIDL
ncbi:hypothetical protein AAE478_005306 [Parahypoxylon ruwenzoriense]